MDLYITILCSPIKGQDLLMHSDVWKLVIRLVLTYGINCMLVLIKKLL